MNADPEIDPPPPEDDEPLTPTEIVRAASRARARQEGAERDIVELALEWAAAHEIHGPVQREQSGPAHEGEFPFPEGACDLDTAAIRATAKACGERVAREEVEAADERTSWRGLPLLRWDAAAGFSAAIGRTTTSGWCLLRQALILRHRLPRVFAGWREGRLTTRVALRIADEVAGQPDDVVTYVDCKLGRRLRNGGTVGPVVAAKLVQRALLELHAEELELERAERLAASYAHWAQGDQGETDLAGLVDYVIRGDYPDVKAFHDTLTELAKVLAHTNHPCAGESMDRRRAVAVGIIADPALAAALLGLGEVGGEADAKADGVWPTLRPMPRRTMRRRRVVRRLAGRLDKLDDRRTSGRLDKLDDRRAVARRLAERLDKLDDRRTVARRAAGRLDKLDDRRAPMIRPTGTRRTTRLRSRRGPGSTRS